MSDEAYQLEQIGAILNGTHATEHIALPSGAATEATLASVLAKIIAAPATAALQTTLNDLTTTPGTATAITPSDATDTTAITAKGILVGVGGTVVVDGVVGGSAITITAVAGQYLPIRAAKVKAASTATGLVGLS